MSDPYLDNAEAIYGKDPTPVTLTFPDGTIHGLTMEQGRRAIAAALSKPTEIIETGWLIELPRHGFSPEWWSLTNTEGEGGYFQKDAGIALRFARKEDAQAYIDDVGWTEAIPTEHQWG